MDSCKLWFEVLRMHCGLVPNEHISLGTTDMLRLSGRLHPSDIQSVESWIWCTAAYVHRLPKTSMLRFGCIIKPSTHPMRPIMSNNEWSTGCS
jgi:hypothetical protein